jgi:hypothetical protein
LRSPRRSRSVLPFLCTFGGQYQSNPRSFFPLSVRSTSMAGLFPSSLLAGAHGLRLASTSICLRTHPRASPARRPRSLAPPEGSRGGSPSCRTSPLSFRPRLESGLLPFVSNAGEHAYEIPSTSSFRSEPWPKQPGHSRMFLGLCFFNYYFTAESHKLSQISYDLFTSLNPAHSFLYSNSSSPASSRPSYNLLPLPHDEGPT